MWTTFVLVAGLVVGGVALLFIGILFRMLVIKIAGRYWPNYVRGGAPVVNIPWPARRGRHPTAEEGDGPAP